MAIFGALGTARSGLVATGAALSVIGNNIANVNTIGFKGSRTDFADLLSAQGGGGSAGKIGLGTRIGRISAAFTQGNIESTGRPTDLASPIPRSARNSESWQRPRRPTAPPRRAWRSRR